MTNSNLNLQERTDVARILGPTQLPSMVFSFETLFVLFLFAGRYKEDPRLSWVPLDLTVLFFALSVAAGIYVLVAHYRCRVSGRSSRLVLTMAILLSWVFTTLLWTPGVEYAGKKTLYLFTLVTWALLSPSLIIGRDVERSRRFYTIVVAFSAWTLSESVLMFFQQEGVGFLYVFGANYLALGTTLGWGAILVIVQLLYGTRSFVGVAVSVLYVVLSLLMMLAGGGRGALFSFTATLLIVGCLFLMGAIRGPLKRLVRRKITILSAFMILLALSVILVFDLSRLQTVGRILVLFTDQTGGRSAAVRLENYSTAWRLWQTRPFLGHGIGSYPLLSLGRDIRLYPHNIFLELLVETGIVGLAGFVALFFSCFRSFVMLFRRGDAFVVAAFCTVVFFLMSSQLSGDITDNRYLFMSLGLFSVSGRDATRFGVS